MKGKPGTAPLKAANDFGNDFIQPRAIDGREENILSMITSQRDMIKATGHMESRLTWHPCARESAPGRGFVGLMVNGKVQQQQIALTF